MAEDNVKDKETGNQSEIDSGASPEEDIQEKDRQMEIVENAEKQDSEDSAIYPQ